MDIISILDPLLIQSYQNLGVNDISLQDNCLNCNICWNGIENRKWDDKELEDYFEENDTDTTKIYLPWIGDYFESQKLLIIGINMNEYGGTYAQRKIVGDWVRSGLLEGKKRILKNDNYAGTFYWYMAPAYASVLIEKKGSMVVNWNDDGAPNPKSLSDTLDYFSITNSIKCSPKGEKSKPSSQMWENCLTHILKQEIKILKPTQILILGTTENFYYFKNKILDQPFDTSIKESGNFRKGQGTIDNNSVEFYSVIHPTAFGGNKNSLIQEFKEFVYSSKIYLIDEFMNQLNKLGYEYEVSNSRFGSENSGFYFKIPGWKNFSIGFEFELGWANSFFYGLINNNVDDTTNSELAQMISARFNMNGEQTNRWPYWEWSEYRNWNDKAFLDIQSGSLLQYVKQTIENIMSKTKDLSL